MIPIFDTLAHPTLSGRWLQSGKDASFEACATSLREHGYIGAAAIGIAGVEDYDDEKFIAACRRYPALVPVAGFNPKHSGAVSDELQRLRAIGYRAIKIHPRYTGLDIATPQLGEVLAAAAAAGLVVFLCTYMHCGIERYPVEDPFYALVRALKAAPAVKVVLLHGGDVQVLRYAELVRFNPSLLLDLSMTLMKYSGSSLDADLAFLFRHCDRRICIGSDHPEWGHAEVRARFEELTRGVGAEKMENAAFRNITAFLGCKPPAA